MYIDEHIDIDPDGAFTSQFVLPVGDHYLQVTSCWGGPDDAYPENGVDPCGTEGLGGGVNDRVTKVRITVNGYWLKSLTGSYTCAPCPRIATVCIFGQEKLSFNLPSATQPFRNTKGEKFLSWPSPTHIFPKNRLRTTVVS